MDKLGKIFAGGVVLLLPFIFSLEVQEQFRLPKENFVLFLAIVFVGILYWKKVSTLSGYAIGIFAISLYFGKLGFPKDDAASVLAGLLVAYPFSQLSIHAINKGLNLFMWLCVFFAFWGLIQVLKLDPIIKFYDWADNRPVCFFGQHTLYGPIAVSGYAVALFNRRFWIAGILAVPVLLIDASFTYLSFAIVNAIFLIHQIGALKTLSLGALGLSLFMIGATKSTTLKESLNDKGRFLVWKHALQIGQNNWIAGHGLGSWKVVYPNLQNAELRKLNGADPENKSHRLQVLLAEAEIARKHSGIFLTAHNEYVQIFFEFGILGLIAVALVFYSFFRSYQEFPIYESQALFAIFFSFAGNAIGSFPLHVVPQSIYILICYVIVCSKAKESYERYI